MQLLFNSPVTTDNQAKTDSHSATYWLNAIRTSWQKSTESIIETGALLLQARKELERDVFHAMRLPFGKRTRERLMKIAGNPVLSLATHASHLPPSWMTLYELSKLPHPTLLAKIEDGTIRPDMERKDATALLGRPKRLPAEPKPDLLAAWATADAETRRLLFDQIGAVSLLTMISPRVRAELTEKFKRQSAAAATKAGNVRPDAKLSIILHAALSLLPLVDADHSKLSDRTQFFAALRKLDKKARAEGKEPAVALVDTGTIDQLLKPHRYV
jgi:hypothetical protein